MHLLMCAIHSAFSVGVAAKTAKDFFGEITCQPFFQAEEEEGGEGNRRGRERERERERVSESTVHLMHVCPWIESYSACVRLLQTYVHRSLATVVSHPRGEECAACYTEEGKRTETSKQVRKYDKYHGGIKISTRTIPKQWERKELTWCLVDVYGWVGLDAPRCLFWRLEGGRGGTIWEANGWVVREREREREV